jgi:hypothetical protein
MLKLFSPIKYIINNPIWKRWPLLIILAIGIILDAVAWYWYLSYYKNIINLTPILFAGAALALNFVLSVIIYPKKDILAFLLLVTAILIQIFIIFYMKIAYLSGAF